MELNQKSLGVFYTDNVAESSTLETLLDKNLTIEGAMDSIRPQVARALLTLSTKLKTSQAYDSYRLMDIFLEKDEEFDNYSKAEDADLFILLLGFGEIKNQRLPDCIMQVITRRELVQLPTWVVLGISRPEVAMKFNNAVFDKVDSFKKVVIR